MAFEPVCPGVQTTGRVTILVLTLVKSTSYCPVYSFRVEAVEVLQRLYQQEDEALPLKKLPLSWMSR